MNPYGQATLFVYSFQIDEDPRFLMPLIPIISVLVAWSLATVRNQIVLGLFLIGLVANAAASHAYAHDSDPFHITALYVSPVHRSADDIRAELRQLKEALAEALLENRLLKKA